MSKIIIGQIIKAQGIKGEVKVRVYTSDLDRFLDYDSFYCGSEIFEVEKSRSDKEYGFVKFKHVKDRNDAELLRGKNLEIEEEELPPLEDEGDYYIFEAKQCDVLFEDGEMLGAVCDILEHPASDIFVVKTKDGEVMFPSLRDLILKVEGKNRKITISRKRFAEVSVYNED